MPFDRTQFVQTPREVIERHGERLRSLIGRTIDATWVAWDAAADEWFADEPVIVAVGSEAVEICCFKLSELGITWNEVDTSQRPAWIADWSWSDFALEWRRDALAELQRAVGRTIREIAVLEYRHSTTIVRDANHPENVGRTFESWLLHGVELTLDEGTLSIYNALDRNGVSSEPQLGPDFRRTAI